MMQSTLKLGTRKSLLAWAQSQWVAREVERLNPNIRVELVGIETRGDKILDIPLREVEGKEFFVAEIDAALKSGAVDFTVHSLKDLSLERPREFVTAAIPKRENPRDVILWGPLAEESLKNGRSVKIGTSSPRRLENIPSFLKNALPRFNEQQTALSQLEFLEIRGNVNTRLGRVHEKRDSPRYLDGVVLAFAGLIRLWQDPAGKAELERLLKGVRWMILPLAQCPAAPGQGALAVECRAEDSFTQSLLKKIHDPQTEAAVRRERNLLAESGGGCHQRFGATARPSLGLGELLYVRGKTSDGRDMEEFHWERPTPIGGPGDLRSAWDGNQWRDAGTEGEPLREAPDLGQNAVFVAHSRAVPDQSAKNIRNARIWVSGTSSWFRLAEKGLWIEGCAEGMGFDDLLTTLNEPVLRLPQIEEWTVLTHQAAEKSWIQDGIKIKVVPTYKIAPDYSLEAKAALREATHVFWSSGSQHDELKEWVSSKVIHACGPGKTVLRLKERGISPLVFPSVKEWRKWLKNLET